MYTLIPISIPYSGIGGIVSFQAIIKKITRKNMILTSSVNNPALFFDDKLSFKTYFFGFVAMLTLASNNVAIPATSTSFSTGTFLSQCRTIKPSFP